MQIKHTMRDECRTYVIHDLRPMLDIRGSDDVAQHVDISSDISTTCINNEDQMTMDDASSNDDDSENDDSIDMCCDMVTDCRIRCINVAVVCVTPALTEAIIDQNGNEQGMHIIPPNNNAVENTELMPATCLVDLENDYQPTTEILHSELTDVHVHSHLKLDTTPCSIEDCTAVLVPKGYYDIISGYEWVALTFELVTPSVAFQHVMTHMFTSLSAHMELTDETSTPNKKKEKKSLMVYTDDPGQGMTSQG